MFDGIKFIENEEIHTQVFENMLERANLSVLIATANLKNVHVKKKMKYISIAHLFRELCDRDVYVSLLFSSEPSSSFLDEVNKLELDSHANFFLAKCPRVHFKCVIVDEKIAYMGSGNLTGAGIGAKSQHKRNFEMGFLIEDSAVIERILSTYTRIIEKSECPSCKLRKYCTEAT